MQEGRARRPSRRVVGIGFASAAIAALISRSRAQAKAPKTAVQYQDQPEEGERCADCRWFVAENRACERVQGDISPQAWCVLFAPAA